MRWKSKFTITNKNDAAAQANQDAQTAFYEQLAANYGKDFGDFEGTKDSLLAKIQPIIDAGPGQYGFAAPEDAAIRGAAIDADAASAQNAQVATQQQIKAQNGGADLIPTGAADELRQQGDVDAAKKLSSDQNTITQAGYKAGQENYEGALTADENVLGMMNPNAFAGATTSGGSSATGAVNAATNAAAASDSWMSLAGGALGGVSGALTLGALSKPPTAKG